MISEEQALKIHITIRRQKAANATVLIKAMKYAVLSCCRMKKKGCTYDNFKKEMY